MEKKLWIGFGVFALFIVLVFLVKVLFLRNISAEVNTVFWAVVVVLFLIFGVIIVSLFLKRLRKSEEEVSGKNVKVVDEEKTAVEGEKKVSNN